MVNQAIQYMAQRNDAHYVSIPDILFRHNIDFQGHEHVPIPSKMIRPGNVYGAFRSYPLALSTNRIFIQAPKILLVRDPRDALVSEYFSMIGSHPLPDEEHKEGLSARIAYYRRIAQETTIDEYVLAAAEVRAQNMEGYCHLLSDPKLLLLRYEDVIFQKEAMLRDIADHFDWILSKQDIADILPHIDIFPDSEDQSEFIRRVTPGDHREKLAPETIAALDIRLGSVMASFGYAK